MLFHLEQALGFVALMLVTGIPSHRDDLGNIFGGQTRLAVLRVPTCLSVLN